MSKTKIDKQLIMLYVFYSILFGSYGVSSYFAKYYGEIGLVDSQIGILASVPAIIGLFFQPISGTISDRVKLKKYVLTVACLLQGILYICCGFTTSFISLLVLMILVNIVSQPISPVTNTIAMEYVDKTKYSFGPIRMSGSIGYQVAALIFGFIMVGSLKGVFPIIGGVMIICTFLTFLLPPIEGHQHAKEKKSYGSLLKNQEMIFFFLILLIGSVAHQYYSAFFTKHLGDLGFGNGITGVFTVGSLFLEIPFLFFSQKLYKKCSMWTWLLIGFFINSIRYLILGFSTNAALMLIANTACVTSAMCFEFFPILYMNERTEDSLKGSAQSLITLVTFGISKVIGSLLGGFLSDAIGIPNVFVTCGVILFVSCIVFFPTCRKHAKIH